MIVSVASGKGGTGKTTIAVNLAYSLGFEVRLLDCDVEEPNCHLFLNGSAESQEEVSIPVPAVDESICAGCGGCAQFCEYGAIAVPMDLPIIFPELCHGCGGCIRICPQQAMREVDRRIGVVETAKVKNINLIQGRLDIGIGMAPPLISAVKRSIQSDMSAIIDAPPGTSCPVITAIRETDFVVLVTEPTPFGLNDLELAVEMVRELKVPFGVVINRQGIGDMRVHSFCREQRIPILLEIPDDRKIAEAYSKGNVIVEVMPEYKVVFRELWNNIVKQLQRVGSVA